MCVWRDGGYVCVKCSDTLKKDLNMFMSYKVIPKIGLKNMERKKNHHCLYFVHALLNGWKLFFCTNETECIVHLHPCKVACGLCVVQQDETTQRHEEYLRQIREKAFEMSILRHSTEDHNDAPEPTPYDKDKLCIICNVLVSFSLSVFYPHHATETSCASSAVFWLVFPVSVFLPTTYDEKKLCMICSILVSFSCECFSSHTLWWKEAVHHL